MRLYIGVDWADATHAVWVEDESGQKIFTRSVPHTVDGLRDRGRWLDEQRAEGYELWAAIERPEGRIVDFLLDHGIVVFPINPKVVNRIRDRFRVSGGKSDPFDARVLANLLRTDHGRLSPLRPSSEQAQELKELTRDYPRHVRQQTRLLNQLTATLKAYYPRALEICEDFKSEWARAFLRDYPTPDTLAQLTERQWQRWARAHRLRTERAVELWPIIAQPQLAIPGHVVRVKARLRRALLEQLTVTVHTVRAYTETISDFFAGMPGTKWAASLPGAARGITVPTLYAELGDAPDRWRTFQHLQGCSGTVPVPTAAARRRSSSSGSRAITTCARPHSSSRFSPSPRASGRAPTTIGVASAGIGTTMRCAPSPRSGSRSSSSCGVARSPTTRIGTSRPWLGSSCVSLRDPADRP